MALEGTHLRFALEVQDKFAIKDIRKYLAGTLYPDSRYMTKIERKLTHDPQYINKKFFEHNDFKKGWAAHLIYDNIQFKILEEVFGDIIPHTTFFHADDIWVTRTALKMLQDMDDIASFNIKTFLPLLDYVETPNNENSNTLKTYHLLIANLYHQAPLITLNDYKTMWLEYSGELETFEKVRNKVQQLQQDESIKNRVKLMYPKTIEAFNIGNFLD